MTNEEAIEAIKCNWPDSRYTILREALDMAISALQQKGQERNAPLNLDELREMPISDWVWIDVLHSKEAVSSYYRKYDGYKKDEIFWCGYPGLGFRFFYEDYGKTWLAYRQKPEEDDHE